MLTINRTFLFSFWPTIIRSCDLLLVMILCCQSFIQFNVSGSSSSGGNISSTTSTNDFNHLLEYTKSKIIIKSGIATHHHEEKREDVLPTIDSNGTTRWLANDDENLNKLKTSKKDEEEKGSQQRRQRRSTTSSTRNRTTTNLIPKFSAPIGNVSAVLGRDVRLVCQVENLGSYQVAWLKEESRTILSIDTNIIITNYRIFLIPDEEERKWVLHIKDVQESDRGFYQCQVNTKPMQSISGYLEVVVPPKFIEPQTSQVAEVVEFHNVSIQCKANGHPRPTITWRRDDGQPIKLTGRPAATTHIGAWNQQQQQQSNKQLTDDELEESSNIRSLSRPRRSSTDDQVLEGEEHQQSDDDENRRGMDEQSFDLAPTAHQLNDVKSDKLTLINVDRSMGGLYVCTASNGIPSQVFKRIALYVKFEPKVSIQNKYISVSLNEQLEIDCLIESFPKANTYWSKKQPQTQREQQSESDKAAANSVSLRPYARPLIRQGGADLDALWWRRKQHPNQEREATTADQFHLGPPNGSTGNSREGEEVVADDDLSIAAAAAAEDEESSPAQQQQQLEKDNFLRQSSLFGKQFSPAGSTTRNKFIIESDAAAAADADLADLKLTMLRKQRRRRQTTVNSIGQLENVDQSSSSIDDSHSSLVDSNEPNQSGQAKSSTTTSPGQNFITIKQTPVNQYTYKLKLIINRMQESDFGEYACVSSNSMGKSEAHVIVTRADRQQQHGATSSSSSLSKDQDHQSGKQSQQQQSNNAEQLMSDENDNFYKQRENLKTTTTAREQQQQQQQKESENEFGAGVRSIKATTNHLGQQTSQQRVVVYDENYLQTIKNRQLANGIAPGRLQQKLKMKPDRNNAISGASLQTITLSILVGLATVWSMMNSAAADYG